MNFTDIFNSLVGWATNISQSVGGVVSGVGDAYSGASETAAFLTSTDGMWRIFAVLFGGLLILGALKYGY